MRQVVSGYRPRSLSFMVVLCVALALVVVAVAGAATVVQLPSNRFMRPVGWPGGNVIEFRAGTVMVDSFEEGVVSGVLANETWLSPWNSTMRIAFAAGSLIQFERTGGVLTGALARDSSLRIAQSSMYVSFRGTPATITFGYDGGVATGVLAQSMWSGSRTYPADTQVSFSAGVVSGALAWVPPGAGNPGVGNPAPVNPSPPAAPDPGESFARFAGVWKGEFRNTLGGGGPTTLTLGISGSQLQGNWDGSALFDVRVSGDLLTFGIADSVNATRYAVEVRLSGTDRGRMSYRVTGGRTYSGTVETLTRIPASGPSPSGVIQPDPYSGYWVGTYRNTLGSSGAITLNLSVQGTEVTGDWDGSTILDGKRTGDKLVWRCYDSQNRNTYAIEFTVSADGVGRLVYTVTGSRSYSGIVENYRRQSDGKALARIPVVGSWRGIWEARGLDDQGYTIRAEGDGLAFASPDGRARSSGGYRDYRTIFASEWGAVGTVSPDGKSIYWDNGSHWER